MAIFRAFFKKFSAYKVGNEETTKYGILEIDGDGFVSNFLEKPTASATESRLACPCFYLFKKAVFGEMKLFLDERKDEPLKERDATGLLIKIQGYIHFHGPHRLCIEKCEILIL